MVQWGKDTVRELTRKHVNNSRSICPNQDDIRETRKKEKQTTNNNRSHEIYSSRQNKQTC